MQLRPAVDPVSGHGFGQDFSPRYCIVREVKSPTLQEEPSISGGDGCMISQAESHGLMVLRDESMTPGIKMCSSTTTLILNFLFCSLFLKREEVPVEKAKGIVRVQLQLCRLQPPAGQDTTSLQMRWSSRGAGTGGASLRARVALYEPEKGKTSFNKLYIKVCHRGKLFVRQFVRGR